MFTLLSNIENYLHELPPQLWLIYHVNMKAIQCGAVLGITCFILNTPFILKSQTQKYMDHVQHKQNKYVTTRRARQLRGHIYETFILLLPVGIGVSIYNLIKLDSDLLQDRVYRIIHSNAQKQIDYTSIGGALFGLLYSFGTYQHKVMDINNNILNNKQEENDCFPISKMIIEYVICNALIGVGFGVLVHLIRTRNFVHPQRIYRYSLQCWS